MQSTGVLILAAVGLLATTTATTANHAPDSVMERPSSAKDVLNQDEQGGKPVIETSFGKRKKREVTDLQNTADNRNQRSVNTRFDVVEHFHDRSFRHPTTPTPRKPLHAESVVSRSRKRREPQLYPDDGSFGQRDTRSTIITNENTEAKSPQFHFDGWYPIGSRDPMSDDPTVEYKPPTVDQVHFSDDPMSEKPLYPILPENPPVIVMRAERNELGINPVYGTENVEYFHINPQTKTVQAFKQNENGNPIQLIAAPQFGDANETSTSQHDKENIDGHVEYPNEASVSNNFDEYDLDGQFSEHYYAFTRPRSGHAYSITSSAPYSHLKASSNDNIGKNPNQRLSNTRFDVVELFHDRSFRHPTTPRPRKPLHARLSSSGFHESQIEEAPYEGAASDNSGAFRQVAAPNFFTNQEKAVRNSLPKTKYNNRKRESTSSRPSTRPWFLIETTVDDHDRNREPSIASYIQPEHHRGDSKIYYKPYGPVSYVSKDDDTKSSHIHNPHLDDHMNSYKPTKSITASSLSELLQIFQFTAVTNNNQESTTPRGFRYTRPTEENPSTKSSLKLFGTSYRYTSTPFDSNVDSTTQMSLIATSSTENLKKRDSIYDPVADTNSIDGYVIADTIDSHVYAQPDGKTNKLNLNLKDSNKGKGISKVTSTTIRPRTTVRPHTTVRPRPTVEAIKPQYFTASSRKPIFADLLLSTKKEKENPLYVIYQGHSKVKVFGINNSPKKKGEKGSYVQVIPTTPISTSTISSTSFLSTKTQKENTVFSSFPSTTPQSTTIISNTTSPSVTTTNQTFSTNSSTFSTSSTTLAPTETANIGTTEEEEYKDPLVAGDVYDYYYDGDYGDNLFFPNEYTDHDDITIINFGGNYPKNSEDWVGHLNRPSYQHLPVDHPLHRLQTPPPSLEALLDSLPAASSFSNPFQQTVHYSEGSASNEGNIPFQQKVHYSEGSASNEGNIFFPPALSSSDLNKDSEGLPVFFTKRRSDGGETLVEKDAVISDPFEHIPQQRELEIDQQKPISSSSKVSTANDSSKSSSK